MSKLSRRYLLSTTCPSFIFEPLNNNVPCSFEEPDSTGNQDRGQRLVMRRKVKSAFADGATTFEEALAGLKKNKNQNGLQNTRSKLNTTLLKPGKDTLGPMLRNFEKSGRLTDDDDEEGHVYEGVHPTTEQLLSEIAAADEESRSSRLEKLLDHLQREIDNAGALSDAVTQGFKKVLNVNDEDVDKFMRQLRAEAQQLQHNKLN
ncbi:hypothetical protein Tco_1509896 [Tanacetum coccineum]